MIAAKIQGYREEIRRKQIDDKFKKTRQKIVRAHLKADSTPDHQDLLEQYSTEISELGTAITHADLFRLHESLEALRKFSRQLPQPVKSTLSQQQYQLVEHICRSLYFLEEITRADMDQHRISPVVHNCFSILDEYIWSSEITEDRILQSKLLDIAAVFLFRDIKFSKKVLASVMSVLANCIRDSFKLVDTLHKLNIHKFLIHAMREVNVPLHDTLSRRFLFFLRSFFSEYVEPPQLTAQEIESCYSGSRAAIDTYAMEDLCNQDNIDGLEDALYIIKCMIDLNLVSYNRSDLNLPDLTDLIPLRNCPIEIKHQILLILDICIYKDEADLTEYLVEQCGIITKIWACCPSLEYIVVNIVSNVALYPSLKNSLHPLLGSLKLLLIYHDSMIQVYTFLLNYLHSQQFQVNTPMEESLVHELSCTTSTNPEIIKIEISIWIGLIKNGYERPPPQRLMENQEMEEADALRTYWAHYSQDGEI